MTEYERWLSVELDDPDLKEELLSVKDQPEEINDRFYRDLAFGTGGLRGVIGAGTNRMNVYTVRKATQGLANYLNKHNTEGKPLSVAIAHDSRNKGVLFSKESAAVLAANGIKAYLYPQLMPTPALSFAVRHLHCDAGICVTASHNPAKYNGYKAYGNDGCQVTEGMADGIMAEIEALDIFADVKKIPFEEALASGKAEYIGEETVNAFIDAVYGVSILGKPADNLKLVYTPLNGSGKMCVLRILDRIGVKDITVVPEQSEPDGNFPVYVPNPESSVMIDSAAERVKQTNADFGIVFDTDVDRAGCILSDGRELNRNRLVAMISAVILENEPGAVIVTDSVTSAGLTKFIEAHGGKHIRFKRGYKNVINKQIELNKEGIDCPLAIETSGHAAFRENYYLDDGAYLVTKLIIKAALLKKSGGSLESFISDLEEPAEELERRFKIDLEDFKPYGEKVIADLKALAEERDGWQAEKINYEGIRINTDKDNGDGWLLLRMSVHDPILVLNLESNTAGGTEKMLSDVTEFLKAYDKLN